MRPDVFIMFRHPKILMATNRIPVPVPETKTPH